MMFRGALLQRPAVGLAAAAFLLAGLLSAVMSGAQAANPAPVRIQIDAITSSTQAPTGTPENAVPSVLVQAGQTFTVEVSFYDSSGEPASFNRDTPLAVTSDQGVVTVLSAVAPRGETAASLQGSMATAVNQVALTVDDTATGRSADDVAPDTSDAGQVFDVLSRIDTRDSRVGFDEGIGGDGACAEATPENPVCGVVLLPEGTAGPTVLLSLGACDPDDRAASAAYAPCVSERGAVVQLLADLTRPDGSDIYSRSSPATIIVKCDKELCGQGAIQDDGLIFSLSGNAALAPVEACPSKGTIGEEQDACIDYVQSRRDGSGDSLLHLLFFKDARTSAR